MELKKQMISLDKYFPTAEEAIRFSGQKLVEQGKVTNDYIEAMVKRQKEVSVYIGNFVGLPHAENTSDFILKEGWHITQIPDGVNLGTETQPQIATILFTVALHPSSQLTMLQELAFFCADIDLVMSLSDATSEEEIIRILATL